MSRRLEQQPFRARGVLLWTQMGKKEILDPSLGGNSSRVSRSRSALLTRGVMHQHRTVTGQFQRLRTGRASGHVGHVPNAHPQDGFRLIDENTGLERLSANLVLPFRERHERDTAKPRFPTLYTSGIKRSLQVPGQDRLRSSERHRTGHYQVDLAAEPRKPGNASQPTRGVSAEHHRHPLTGTK